MGFAVLAILETVAGLYILGASRYIYVPGNYLDSVGLFRDLDTMWLAWVIWLPLLGGYWMRFRVAGWNVYKTLMVGFLFMLMDLLVVFVKFIDRTTYSLSPEEWKEMSIEKFMDWFWAGHFQVLVFPLVCFFAALLLGNLIARFFTRYRVEVVSKAGSTRV